MIKAYIEDYLSVNLADYPNIGIDFEISKFLLIIAVALCASFFVLNWHRSYMSLAMKKLFRHEAFDESSAKTLPELGLSSSRSVKWALSHDTRLAKLIKRVGAREYTYEEYMSLTKGKKGQMLDKPDFEKDKFYIKGDALDEARNIKDNYSGSVLKTIIFSLMFIIIFVGLTLMMPEILTLINSALES